MQADAQQVRSIFLAAVEQHPPGEWPAYLDEVCAGQPALRQRVEVLLQAHEQSNSLLDEVAPNSVVTAASQPVPEAPGAVIGPYKLLQQIGEGGMGIVYMAQQLEPVKRLVALKIIKAGMDTRQVVARFEAERQALALMDHPNIAKVLQGGTTESGRPYFVMELVKGVPVTKYCDEHRLTPRQRLELFVLICQAVQHAHQKGIIHRDLKPSNVLVAPYDGRPVVKIIDFGVAKATGQQLTDKTLVTAFGSIVGTLEYMSPEQAELNNQDIDTRSDIYSLGVLLYELLTGTTPLTRGQLQQEAFMEMLRLIREEEPPRPSTRLSTTAELVSIAANRGLEPKRLSGLVRGELDWIVMKCLEKDRGRRYETANGLARDLERYLKDETVQACPPSAGYRFRKFARRNKALVLVMGLVGCVLLLLTAVGITLFVNIALRDERDLARTQQQRAEQAELRALDAEREITIRAHLARAMAFRRSGQVGQRTKTLAEVALALPLNPSSELRQDLRNEAIAALCLPDMEVAKEWGAWPSGLGETDFDAEAERFAQDDAQGNISVRRVADDVEIARLPSSGKLAWVGVTLSPDGRFLAQRCQPDGRIKLWQLDGPKPQVVLQATTGVPSATVAFRPDSRQLAIQQPDAFIRVYDTATGQQVKQWPVGGVAERLEFHPSLPILAVGSGTTVRLLDLDAGKILATFPHPARVAWTAYHPDGNLLAVSCDDRKIYLWDPATGKQALPPLTGHLQQGIGCCFNHAGDRLISGGWDGMLRLWDPWTGQQLLTGTGGLWGRLRFSGDDRLLSSVRQGGSCASSGSFQEVN